MYGSRGVLLFVPLAARSQGLNTSAIDQALGRSGQKAGEVYRVGFPRTDLHVIVKGVSVKAGLALGSWAAFSGTDENAMVMGHLVLLDSDVNPVMEKQRAASFEITAVHNHLLGERPHVMYMHYMGHGGAAQIAASLKAEFDLARSEAITEGGMTLASPQGAAESINFQGAGADKVVTKWDFVLTADDMLTEQSRLFFMHFWATDNTASVAAGISHTRSYHCNHRGCSVERPHAQENSRVRSAWPWREVLRLPHD